MKTVCIFFLIAAAPAQAAMKLVTLPSGETFHVIKEQNSEDRRTLMWRRVEIPSETVERLDETPLAMVVTREGSRMIGRVQQYSRYIKVFDELFFPDGLKIEKTTIKTMKPVIDVTTRADINIRGVLLQKTGDYAIVESIALPYESIELPRRRRPEKKAGLHGRLKLNTAYLAGVDRASNRLPAGGLAALTYSHRLPSLRFYRLIPGLEFSGDYLHMQKNAIRVQGAAGMAGAGLTLPLTRQQTLHFSSMVGLVHLWMRNETLKLTSLTLQNRQTLAWGYRFGRLQLQAGVHYNYIADQSRPLSSVGPFLSAGGWL